MRRERGCQQPQDECEGEAGSNNDSNECDVKGERVSQQEECEGRVVNNK